MGFFMVVVCFSIYLFIYFLSCLFFVFFCFFLFLLLLLLLLLFGGGGGGGSKGINAQTFVNSHSKLKSITTT